ncbi:Beta-barrel assembly machine subunit BamE [Rhodovulum bhavnagarense]|uniref:Beta-barrel assembly machine subunit BamE n=1 Tax=Rhodovulum bhavnagarense TaxID=992286 RepID=A0A4R2RS70_9RHOB|nr:outer membrane protein assembly factor BamE [Rhodovulum bhavnagarense]TCP61995.1 Beta-barrel assembly machine subunit BamE [Rhodovulum bhavnagarense]
MAKRDARWARWIAVGLLAGAMASCSPIYRNHGYAPSDSDLEQILVGVDSRASVAELVGSPQVAGVMRDDAWYYVASRTRTVAYRAPEEIGREVVAISFDEGGTVSNIERFGLEDGRVIALNRRVTDDNIKGVSFIRQLLGSVGQLRAEDLID